MSDRILVFAGLAIAVLVGACALMIADPNFVSGHRPTADELYGCTIAQQAPNGECK